MPSARHFPLFQPAEFAVCVGSFAYGDCKAAAARHLHVEFRALSNLPGADDIRLRIGLVIGIGGIGVERRHVLLTGIEVSYDAERDVLILSTYGEYKRAQE